MYKRYHNSDSVKKKLFSELVVQQTLTPHTVVFRTLDNHMIKTSKQYTIYTTECPKQRTLWLGQEHQSCFSGLWACIRVR